MSGHETNVSEWLPRARAGSRDALGQALEAVRAYLLLVANRELDPELQAKGGASDLVQETFLEAQRDFAQFRGDSGEQFQAWLRQLLLNNLSNFARRYRQVRMRQVSREVALHHPPACGSRQPDLACATLSPSGQAMAHERARDIEAAMARLPEDYAQVIHWRYQDELSFTEIAQRMGRSENAVRKLWFRAIERLRGEMDVSQ